MGVLNRFFTALIERRKLLKSPLIAVAIIAVLSFLTIWIFEDWLPALPVAALLTVWLVLSGAFTEPERYWTAAIERVQAWLYTDTRRQMVAQGQQGYLSSLAMGVVFSAGWTPCIGPIYGTILTMAAAGGDVGQAGSQLAAYSLGLGIPFIFAALMLDSAQGILRRLQRYLHAIEMAAGTFLIVIGILVASGQLQSLSQNFANQFADFSYRLEECAVDLYEGRLDFAGFVGCASAAPGAETDPVGSASSDAGAPLEVVSITDLAGSLPSTDSSPQDSPQTGTAVGSLAPLFTTVDDAGQPFTLEDVRGQTVLLNFWATWCGPCRIEMPQLQQAYETYSDRQVLVVAVNNRETLEEVSGFRLERRLTFPLLMDETGSIQDTYGIQAYPSTFLIDGTGVIRAIHYGPLTGGQIQALLDEALS